MGKGISDWQWKRVNEIYEEFTSIASDYGTGQSFYGYCYQGDAIMNETNALKQTWKQNMQSDHWVKLSASLWAFGTALYLSGNLGEPLYKEMTYWVRSYKQLNEPLYNKCMPNDQLDSYREVLDF